MSRRAHARRPDHGGRHRAARSTRSRSRWATSWPAWPTRRSSASPRTSAASLCDDRGPAALRVVAVDAAAVRADPRLHRRHQPALRRARRRVEARRRRHPQPPLLRRLPPARRRVRRARSSTASELVGFSATTAHHLDLGALTPGQLRDRRRDRRVRRGAAVQRDQDRGGGPAQRLVWQILRDNCRAPQLVVGDMEAQVAAAQDRRRALRRADRRARPRDGPRRERGPHGLLGPDAAPRDREAPGRHVRGGGHSTASSTTRPRVPRPRDQGRASRSRAPRSPST